MTLRDAALDWSNWLSCLGMWIVSNFSHDLFIRYAGLVIFGGAVVSETVRKWNQGGK